jgi:hypothetical protein
MQREKWAGFDTTLNIDPALPVVPRYQISDSHVFVPPIRTTSVAEHFAMEVGSLMTFSTSRSVRRFGVLRATRRCRAGSCHRYALLCGVDQIKAIKSDSRPPKGSKIVSRSHSQILIEQIGYKRQRIVPVLISAEPPKGARAAHTAGKN